MRNERQPVPVAAITFPGALTLIFITLKLTGFITWSWWWVLSPIWISWVVFGAIIVFILALAIAASFGGRR